MTVNAAFTERLAAMLEKSGLSKDAPLVFICRSGARSQSAAIAMHAAGWAECYNLSGGFEGPPDAERHRGLVSGWKASGLPWTQS
jgi:rhodanese-related sulfurtransferase